MRLYIKNMVCNRCKIVVRDELVKFGFHPLTIELGEVELAENLTAENLADLKRSFHVLGFEIIDDKKSRLIEQIKNSIVDLVHHSGAPLQIKLSEFISRKLHQDYNYLSNIFSEIQGTTIEKYLIAQKIEKVKELLKYDELSLSEIADLMGYSSVAYLSNQFKKQTGLSPSFYKSAKTSKRNNLDEL